MSESTQKAVLDGSFFAAEQLPSPAPRVTAAMVEAGTRAAMLARFKDGGFTSESALNRRIETDLALWSPWIEAALIAALAVEGK